MLTRKRLFTLLSLTSLCLSPLEFAACAWADRQAVQIGGRVLIGSRFQGKAEFPKLGLAISRGQHQLEVCRRSEDGDVALTVSSPNPAECQLAAGKLLQYPGLLRVRGLGHGFHLVE